MVIYFLEVGLIGLGMWGQHWYDRAKRLEDTITYMVMDEVGRDEEAPAE